LTEKANHYYKLFINWTNEKIKKTFVKRCASRPVSPETQHPLLVFC